MGSKDRGVLMPTEVSTRVGFFDRFAGVASLVSGRAAFCAGCVLLIGVWAPIGLLVRDIATRQVIINTASTISTSLMVALLQSRQARNSQAVHHKPNAIADGLSDLMAQLEDRL